VKGRNFLPETGTPGTDGSGRNRIRSGVDVMKQFLFVT
jgi:hypothetical protein